MVSVANAQNILTIYKESGEAIQDTFSVFEPTKEPIVFGPQESPKSLVIDLNTPAFLEKFEVVVQNVQTVLITVDGTVSSPIVSVASTSTFLSLNRFVSSFPVWLSVLKSFCWQCFIVKC